MDFGRNRSLSEGVSFYCLACNRERNDRWYRHRRRRLGNKVCDLPWEPGGFRWCPACKQAVADDDHLDCCAIRLGRARSG
jgi:hypothetical protein